MSHASLRIAFVVLVLALALLYFHELGQANLWMDEIWWAFQVTEPDVRDTLRLHAHARPPLLLTLAARAAMQVLPRTEAGFRVLPALLGVLCVILFWKWAAFLPPGARLSLAGLFGALPPLLTWTHLFKHYTADIAATLVVVLTVEAFLRAPPESRRPYRLALAVGVALGLSFTVFFWVPLVLGLIVGTAVLRRRGALQTGDLRPALVLAALALAYFRFWPNDPSTFLQFAPGSVPPVSYVERARWLVLQCGRVVATPLLPIPLPLQAVGLVVGAAVAWKERRLSGLWLFPILALLALAGVFGFFPLAGGRFTLFVFPLVFMTFGLGLHALVEGGARAFLGRLGAEAGRWATAGLALVALALAFPGLGAFIEGRDGRPREQIADALAALEQERGEEDGVFVNRLALAGWQWYAHDRSRAVGSWRRSPSGMDVYVGSDERFRDQSFAQDMRVVFGAGKRRVFFLLSHLETPAGRETDLAFVRRHVSRFGEVEEVHAEGGALLWRVTPRSSPTLPASAP